MKLLNIFKKNENDNNEISKLDTLTKLIIENSDDTYLKKYVSDEKYLDDFSLLKEDDYCYLLQELYHDKMEKTKDDLKKYYDTIVFKDQDIEFFRRVINLYLKNKTLFQKKSVLDLINCFENKQIVFKLYNLLKERDWDNAINLIVYIHMSRPFFVSEAAFFSRILVLDSTLECSKKEDCENIIQEFSIEDKKSFGIYDIDEQKLVELDEKLRLVNLQFTDLKIQADKIINEINTTGNNAALEISKLISKETKEYQDKYNEVKNLLDNILKESSQLGDSYIEKIKTLGDKYLSLIDTRIPDSIKMVEELDKKIDTLSKKQNIVSGYNIISSKKIETSYGTIKVNPFLNKDIEVEKRYKMAIDAKSKDEVYHAKFDDILKLIITGFHPMLVGPSGVGKTYSIRQISKLLNLPLYNIGFVADEHEKITGFIDAAGNYHATDFYKAFKYGGLCFFDEIDNSESKALIELNKILERTGYLEYIFPNGERLQASPNFVVVAASNTWGDGANLKYTAREMLDSATLERFIIEAYNRDSTQEKNILKGYDEYYKFALAYRGQLENHPAIRTEISTGSLYSIRDFLDAGIYTDEKIFEYIFRKNIDISVLRNIYDNLSDVQDTNLGKVLKKVINNE